MDLAKEIARALAPVKPKRVILFGSQARGDADEISDVDLIVVYETDKRFLDRLAELYALWDLPYAVDMLAYTPEEFERMRVDSGFVADAVEHGKVIVETT